MFNSNKLVFLCGYFIGFFGVFCFFVLFTSIIFFYQFACYCFLISLIKNINIIILNAECNTTKISPFMYDMYVHVHVLDLNQYMDSGITMVRHHSLWCPFFEFISIFKMSQLCTLSAPDTDDVTIEILVDFSILIYIVCLEFIYHKNFKLI